MYKPNSQTKSKNSEIKSSLCDYIDAYILVSGTITVAEVEQYTKIQLHEISQSARFLGKRLGPLLKAGLPLMKNLLKTLATSVKPNTIRFNNSKISNRCRYSKKKKVWIWSSTRLRFA